jgi:putative FmdB family regulatory protein
MPIFEYRCEACGFKFDRFFRSLEEEAREKITCSSCGSDRMRKLVSLFGLGGNAAGCSTTGSFKSG